MSVTWNTKWGVRRVRVEPPTVEEALIAAEGLSGDPLQQVQITADLMSLPVEEVKPAIDAILKQRVRRPRTIQPSQSRGGTVVVERKVQRKVLVGRR